MRILTDCQLSLEDYKILSLRVRGFAKYQKDIKVYEKYKLSLICVGVYAFRYESDVEIAIQKVQHVLENVPQYMLRKLFDICEVVLEENNLTTYGIHIVDQQTLKQALVIQAGLSKEQCKEIFQYCEMENKVTLDGMLTSVRWKSYEPCIKILDKILKKRFFMTVVQVYEDCIQKDVRSRELEKKYSELSLNVIQYCVDYCIGQREKLEQKLVK